MQLTLQVLSAVVILILLIITAVPLACIFLMAWAGGYTLTIRNKGVVVGKLRWFTYTPKP